MVIEPRNLVIWEYMSNTKDIWVTLGVSELYHGTAAPFSNGAFIEKDSISW
jgi:hypothetical protein